ncbi:MAG TPA: alkaline phosphatase [Pseudothermotoga sp.]|nr:alkaline phosphatase [Pseudothermotoga sp.]
MFKKFLVLIMMVAVSSVALCVNVIFLIGDGMSTNQLVLASILEGKVLNIMKLPYSGITLTYSADSWVTDSAPAGTALATGFKTLNKAIGVLPNNEPVYSMVELARDLGYKTGIVVACRVTHATPASFYGHVANRDDELVLAEQLSNAGIDVVFGGGYSYFLPESKGGTRKDGKDLVEKMIGQGYEYITKKSELDSIKGEKVLGLFAPSHLAPVTERTGEQPTLDVMTKKAIEILSRSSEDFILMVEGSQIDWEAHANDFYGVWKEVMEFDNAVKVAIDFAKQNGNTLVVVTGDHETGGLSLSKGGYSILVDQARNAKGTTTMFLKQFKIQEKEKFIAGLKDWYNVEVSDQEYEMLAKIPANELRRELARFVSGKLGFGWTTYDHTAGPVPIYAFGLGAQYFTGFMDNTDVAKLIMKLCGISSATFPVIGVAVSH